MDKVDQYLLLQDKISKIRQNSSQFITNYYPNEAKDRFLINNGRLELIEDNDVCIIVKKYNGFKHISFATSNLTSAINSIEQFLKKDNSILVTDIIGLEEQTLEIQKEFENCDFELRLSLQRMLKIGVDENNRKDNENVVIASEKDLEDILDILQSNFDIYAEQIPEREELQDFINKKLIYLYKIEDEIAGLMIFELFPSSFYLRYWYTSTKYRNRGIASSLYKKAMFISGNIKRQMLWVVQDNKNAIERYEHYGFKKDKLIDKVMIRNAKLI